MDHNTTLSDISSLPQMTAQVIAWVRQAGEIAMHHFEHALPHYKSDDTLVTQADVEIEQLLVTQIRTAYPDHNLISEEIGWGQTGSTSPYTWVIDPLDGTTAFVQELPGWGIGIGLLHKGQPIFGLFYMPLLKKKNLTYTTATGICNNERILYQTIQQDWGRKGFLAVSTGTHRDFDINVPRTRAIGSVGASLVYTACGSATATFIPKANVWDLVAGGAILSQAGGELRYLSGKPVEYEPLLDGRLALEPIIAGHPDLLDELQSAIRERNQDILRTG